MFLLSFLYAITAIPQEDYILDRGREPLTDIEITPLETIILT